MSKKDRGLKMKAEVEVEEGLVEEREGSFQGWLGGYMTVFERAARRGRGERAWRRWRAGKM